MIALNKTLDPADFPALTEELKIVDRHFTSARPQHEMRRWEYAMALKARRAWLQADYEHYGHANRTHGHRVMDVGGAGSPFSLMLGEDAGCTPKVIDPDPEMASGTTLEQHLRMGGHIGHEVFCLSVLEHVDDLDQFLYHLSCLVAPGGLLFLTFDFCDRPSNARPGMVLDTYHFHWMRKRIFNLTAVSLMLQSFITRDFNIFGDFDETYHGPQVYDYTFHSLALVKKP